jgi:hypothetical protein
VEWFTSFSRLFTPVPSPQDVLVAVDRALRSKKIALKPEL